VRIYLLYALIVSMANHHFFVVFRIYSSGVAYLMFYLFIYLLLLQIVILILAMITLLYDRFGCSKHNGGI
jgi:hypothetical protein